jgi:hypothetical protein
MAGQKPFWTVFGIYDDNEQPFTDHVEAKTWQDARSKVLRESDAVILIAGIVPGKITPVDIEGGSDVIPIRGKSHVVEVTAVALSKREFALPSRCPSCKANTRRAGSLVEVNLQLRHWSAHLSHNGKELSHARGGKSHDGDMIETCALRCAKCSHMIWDGIHGDK